MENIFIVTIVAVSMATAQACKRAVIVIASLHWEEEQTLVASHY